VSPSLILPLRKLAKRISYSPLPVPPVLPPLRPGRGCFGVKLRKAIASATTTGAAESSVKVIASAVRGIRLSKNRTAAAGHPTVL